MEGALAPPQSHITCAVSQVGLLQVSNMQKLLQTHPCSKGGSTPYRTLNEPNPSPSRSPQSCAGSSVTGTGLDHREQTLSYGSCNHSHPPLLPASQATHPSLPERTPFKAREALRNSSCRRDKFLMNRQIGLEFALQQLPQLHCLNVVLFSLMLRREKEEVEVINHHESLAQAEATVGRWTDGRAVLTRTTKRHASTGKA